MTNTTDKIIGIVPTMFALGIVSKMVSKKKSKKLKL